MHLDKALPKFDADEYNEFEIYLKWIDLLKWEVVFANKFFAICPTEVHHKDKAHQSL